MAEMVGRKWSREAKVTGHIPGSNPLDLTRKVDRSGTDLDFPVSAF